jgi:hypothetical protein
MTEYDELNWLEILIPSRGRPETVEEIHHAFLTTCDGNTGVTFVVDADDPKVDDYRKAVDACTSEWLGMIVVPGGTMVKALNEGLEHALAAPGGDTPYAVGFFGDDHRPRTPGWDVRYLAELHRLADQPGGAQGVGFVYGDDTIQGEAIPTQIAITTEALRRMGWFSPGSFRHLCIDLVWKELGAAAGRISYLPDVVVEHLHPIKTGNWTEGHIRVNSAEINDADHAEFQRWLTGTGPDDKPAATGRLTGLTG